MIRQNFTSYNNYETIKKECYNCTKTSRKRTMLYTGIIKELQREKQMATQIN